MISTNEIPNSERVTLTSTWFILPGMRAAAWEAIEKLAQEVEKHEPDTLAYAAHSAFDGDSRLVSLPPIATDTVLFIETYRSPDAFLAHLTGPIFTEFVATYGSLFVQANGKPYTLVQFLSKQTGFIRPSMFSEPNEGNRHPVVMFEIMANNQSSAMDFYRSVFGWNYELGTGGFQYVKFPTEVMATLGGIGQVPANPPPGFTAGHNFYLRVKDLDHAIKKAVAAGGSILMEPLKLDSYTFAMINDPEGNPIGLIEPFA